MAGHKMPGIVKGRKKTHAPAFFVTASSNPCEAVTAEEHAIRSPPLAGISRGQRERRDNRQHAYHQGNGEGKQGTAVSDTIAIPYAEIISHEMPIRENGVHRRQHEDPVSHVSCRNSFSKCACSKK